MLYFKHIFGILTLQTGTILLSSLFITLAICVLLVNSLALDTEAPLTWIVMFLFIGYMIVIWLISFYGAYEESQNGITAATIMWTIYIIIWLKLVIYSYIDAQAICLENRCPDVIWLLSNPWHKKQEECNKVFQNSSKYNNQSLYEKKNKPQMFDDRIKIKKNTEKIQLVTTAKISHHTTVPMFDKYENRSDIKTNEVKLVLKKCIETPIAHNNEGYMIVSIIVSLLYLLLTLYSWMVLISYREEIILLQTNLANNNNL
ncbi:uncharacterized protein LOC132947223 [Metopolophium dirhodum]|uniref:uncharacterized protein LOC132947223 n=1 Tax=Metopolophium dirhodum TaxID=44670 RepID=UPI0029903211|nr:uncharacterized protein LOC132947223 [Metopolophium dirhodum]